MGTVTLKLKDTGGAGLHTCGVSFKRDRQGKAIPVKIDESYLDYVLDKYGDKLVKHRPDDDGSSRKKRVPIPDVPTEMTRADRRRAKNAQIEAENAAADGTGDDDEIVSTPKKKAKKKPAKKGKKNATAKKKATAALDAKDGEAMVGGATA